MVEKPRTLAYLLVPRSPERGAVERSVFQLAASANEPPCPAATLSPGVELMGDRGEAQRPLPVLVAADHTVTCSSHAFLHEKVLAFSCAASGLDCR